MVLRFERVPFKMLALHFFSWMDEIKTVQKKAAKKIVQLFITEQNSAH